MFWMFGVACCGCVSRGANTCGAMARVPPGGASDGLGFCSTDGLLAAICIAPFAGSNLLTPTAGDVSAASSPPPPQPREALAGVCIGGLARVTVGAHPAAFGALAGEVLMIAVGVAADAVVLALLTDTGPLLMRGAAGWGEEGWWWWLLLLLPVM